MHECFSILLIIKDTMSYTFYDKIILYRAVNPLYAFCPALCVGKSVSLSMDSQDRTGNLCYYFFVSALAFNDKPKSFSWHFSIKESALPCIHFIIGNMLRPKWVYSHEKISYGRSERETQCMRNNRCKKTRWICFRGGLHCKK